MNILFLTLSQITNIEAIGLYNDLMRKFMHDGHNVHIVVPLERKMGRKTEIFHSGGVTILGVKTLNIRNTNMLEKGIGILFLEYQYMSAIKKYFGDVHFDLVLYSTPPITFNKVIKWVKQRYEAKTYLMLKDIFPQNAVDLGMFTKNSPVYKMFRRKERVLYQISDYIGCMSPANCRYVINNNPEINPEIVEVCPNSIEVMEQRPVDVEEIKHKYNIPTDKVLCIYGGNFGRPQGIDFLIECIHSNEKRDNSFFVVIGNGTEFGKIKTWFNQHQPKNAILMKSLPSADYNVLMRSVDIGLIFLDRRFTIPNYPSRLLSYLENRIPVMMAIDLNTDIGTIAEENGYGLWAESGDLAAFNSNLDKLIANNTMRSEMGKHGYQFLLDNYTVAHTANAIMKHFEK